MSIADRLKICLRPGDTIARLGGDEFAVLVENLKSVDDATHIAERIQKELALPFHVADQDVFTSASIGITLNNVGRAAHRKICCATPTRRCIAPRPRAARATSCSPRACTPARWSSCSMETALRRALERNELLVHYQPIVSLETGEITSCEALVRWQHPERGLILPGEFVPLAEETGPDRADERLAAAHRLRAGQGLAGRRAAARSAWRVNISPRQLKQENLFNTVSQAAVRNRISARTRLELELTESALMESAEETIKPLVELSAKGVQISLDDFGTGYSSLVYLRRFPISKLKIDASFVRDITTDVGDAAIASGLIALAHSLDLRVTAEGVETMEQLEFLRRRKCDDVQGPCHQPAA